MSNGKHNVKARFHGNCSRSVFIGPYKLAPLLKSRRRYKTNNYVPAEVAKL